MGNPPRLDRYTPTRRDRKTGIYVETDQYRPRTHQQRSATPDAVGVVTTTLQHEKYSPKHPLNGMKRAQELALFSQSYRVIRRFGSPLRLAHVFREINIAIPISEIRRWLRKGFRDEDGLIPSGYIKSVLKAAFHDGVLLSAWDWDPRPLPIYEDPLVQDMPSSKEYSEKHHFWRDVDEDGIESAEGDAVEKLTKKLNKQKSKGWQDRKLKQRMKKLGLL